MLRSKLGLEPAPRYHISLIYTPRPAPFFAILHTTRYFWLNMCMLPIIDSHRALSVFMIAIHTSNIIINRVLIMEHVPMPKISKQGRPEQSQRNRNGDRTIDTGKETCVNHLRMGRVQHGNAQWGCTAEEPKAYAHIAVNLALKSSCSS